MGAAQPQKECCNVTSDRTSGSRDNKSCRIAVAEGGRRGTCRPEFLVARSLFSRLISPFRRKGPKDAGGRRPRRRAGASEEMHAQAREMARLIAKYLQEGEAKARGNSRRDAIRAAKAEARRAARSFNVVSFPKSGRTWLRVMLDDLKLGANYTHDGSGHSMVGHVEELQPASEVFAGKTVVFLYRDPRDTVVSGYFQASKRVNTYAGTLSNFVRDPRHGIEKIVRFNMEWLERGPTLCKFMPVTYEELRADTAGTLARIVAFVGAERDAEAIRATVEEASFERMKEKEASGELADRYGKALLPADSADPHSYKVREGLIGGFRKHLGDDDIAYCDEILQRLGYPLDRHGSCPQ